MASHGGTIKSAITNLIKSPDSKAASAFTIPNNLEFLVWYLKITNIFFGLIM